MTKTNTEAVEALEAQRAIDPQTHPLVIAIEQAIAWFDDYAQSHAAKAREAVAVDDIEAASRQAKARTNANRAEYLRAALSPTAKTEPSAAGLERALWLVNVVEGNVRARHPKQADQLQEVWRILRDALSAPTREREESKAIERAAKYDELIYAVGNKYPGETRHETALRYIRQAEEPKGGPGDALLKDQASE